MATWLAHALDRLLGRPLTARDERQEQVGAGTAIPVLGLDALASAAYGPEAALTVLIPIGAASALYLGPIVAVICVILALVAMSYRQTISAYPGGGGSFTVASENLGSTVGVVAGAALAVDYILNVAIGISAGVGALASAVPALLPHLLACCLVLLALITVVNLRGIRQSARTFGLPTLVFVGGMAVVIAVGIVKSIAARGSPEPVSPPPTAPAALEAASAWLLIRAFASGCTAMTGVEAVSNAVPIFRDPRTVRARGALTAIVATLIAMLLGIGYLGRAYGIAATEPGSPGYQSVLSMVTAAVLGRGTAYYVVIAAILAVLALSANTSFADFPRMCRLLALRHYLPGAFAERGRRLVFTTGIVVLAVLSGLLLAAFGGVTDRLIPLFALGALLAFTLSQAGMVGHWLRVGGRGAKRSMALNGIGATATGATLVVVAVSKFTEGAWLVVAVVPLVAITLAAVRRHHERIASLIATTEPLQPPPRQRPLVVLAADAWTRSIRLGLAFAYELSDDVFVVQIKTESDESEDLSTSWDQRIAQGALREHVEPPKLVVLRSPYRQFFAPFVDFVRELERAHPDRGIAVVIPELVIGRWYERIFHNNRARLLRALLIAETSDRVVLVTTPYHLPVRCFRRRGRHRGPSELRMVGGHVAS